MKVREAVELLGGRMAVGKVLGVSDRTVSDWMTRNKVSGAKTMAFYDLCKKYNVDIKINEVVGK